MNSAVPLDVRTGEVDVNGVLWRYHRVGSGDIPLLVLSGSLGASAEMAALIAAALPVANIIVPEYAPVATVADCMAAFDRILDREGVYRVAVFGGSFGGLLAQCWCRQDPRRVTHMILSGAGAPDARRVRKNKKSVRGIAVLPMGLIRMLLRLMLRFMIRCKTPGTDTWKQLYSDLIQRLSRADVRSRYLVAIDLDSHYRFLPDSLPASVRILILEGEQDRLASASVRRELREIYPSAQTHVFAGAGHSSMITHTAEWARVITDFISRVDR